jgi:transposase-like protein
MHIVAHLGHDDKSYGLAAARYCPDRCMACGGGLFGPHDGYERWGLRERIVVRRFRCHSPGCRQVWSVLPSYLTRLQMYATAVETAAVLCYVLQGRTYRDVAEAVGVSMTTVFRWVADGAGAAACTWGLVVRTLLEYAPEQPTNAAVEAEDKVRATKWQARRVRPAKVQRLLELCVLARCLEIFAEAMRPAWPAARHIPAWGLWRWANYPTRKWQTVRATNDGNSRASPGC